MRSCDPLNGIVRCRTSAIKITFHPLN